jgi:arylsulfatase A-like enzyme
MDAHTPYLPPEPFLSRFLPEDADTGAARKIGRRPWKRYYLDEPYPPEEIRTISNLYDGEVAGVDHYVGDLLETLREDGRYDDTLIIVTSDHGEHLGENGLIEHVFGLYNTTVKVPLLVRLPGGGRAGETDANEGQILDLFPTVLAACGVSDEAFAHHGHDLLSDAPGGEGEREGIFAEYYWPVQVLSNFTRDELDANIDRLTPHLHRMRALQRDGYRLIWSSQGRHEFYDLNEDPGEARNLFDPENPDPLFETYLDRLENAVDVYSGGKSPGPEPGLDSVAPGILRTADPEAIDALRELGYVN